MNEMKSRRTGLAAHRLGRLAGAMDRLSDGIGRIAGWLTLAMVLIGAWNAIARYAGRYLGVGLGSNLYLELQWYLFSAVFLLGAAYALRRNDHVRVDVLSSRLSRRGRAIVEIAGTLLLLIPFCVFGIVVSWPSVRNSWTVLETSPDPGGLPRYPLKTLIPVAFALLLLQGLAGLVRALDAARTRR